jgi:hypothetical protein
MSRRFGADALLAVLLPAACVLALLVLHPDRDQPAGARPVETPLTTTSLVCPSALAGDDRLGVGTVGADPGDRVDGEVQVGLGEATVPVRVRTGRISAASPGTGPAVVTGEDELAPGLVGGRSRSAPLAAVDCAAPVADQWFTAAGAVATHDSVVELVNPNAGPAIADIVVRSPTGVVEVPSLRGVSVPGGTSTRLDLGQVVPRQGELSLEVHTSRGRLAVHVVDSYDELGTGTRAEDWLPAQAEPARTATLLGLVPGAGERRLVLANPGADEVRADIKVVTPTSSYAPTGVEPLRVAPDSTAAVSLDDVLAQAAQDGATGVLVEATGPVTASLRQVVDGDTSLLTAAPAVDRAVAVVPDGAARVLIGGADAVGVATVAAYDAKGRPLPEQRVELTPGGGADVPLPEGSVLVTLVAERTSVRAAVLLTGTGASVVPLRELVLTGLVPDVRPGVP